jgi:hypothetical protein
MGDRLPALFAELARDWRGFDGAKSWSSLEGEFSHLTAQRQRSSVPGQSQR